VVQIVGGEEQEGGRERGRRGKGGGGQYLHYGSEAAVRGGEERSDGRL